MGPKSRILLVSVALGIYVSQRNGQAGYGDLTSSSGVAVLFIELVVLSFITQFLLYFAWSVYIYPRFFSPLRQFPLAKGGNILFGHTRDIIAQPTGKLQKKWIEEIPNDGIIRYRMWLTDRLFVTSTKALGEVLVQKNYDFIKPTQVRNGLKRILGLGILLAEGEEHKTQRKNLSPAFSYRHVKNLYPTFWSKGREMVQCLAEATASAKSSPSPKESKTKQDQEFHHPGAVSVGDFVSRATLDIIGLAGMGNDFDSLRNPNNKLNVMYRTVFNPGRIAIVLQIISTFVPFWLLTRLPIQRNRDIAEASQYIKELCLDMIQKKRRALNEKGQVETDIISAALQSESFTDEQLVNQCMTFLAAGHETTATAMTWALLFLSQHQDVQEKLRADIRVNLPSIDADITAAEIDNCHYLQAVCLEVLRIRSPVTLTLRIAACDTSICGKFVPKGTLIILVPDAINTSKELWGQDAGEFKPERWLDADGKANSRGSASSAYSFLTFLHGPRACIGQKFAQAEFACLLAAWIGRFKTTLEPNSPLAEGEPPIAGGVTAKPKGGVWVTLEEVHGW